VAELMVWTPGNAPPLAPKSKTGQGETLNSLQYNSFLVCIKSLQIYLNLLSIYLKLFKSITCTSILPILKDHFQQINTGKPFPGRVNSSTEKIVFK
jgi:hypothetical protein